MDQGSHKHTLVASSSNFSETLVMVELLLIFILVAATGRAGH